MTGDGAGIIAEIPFAVFQTTCRTLMCHR
ncbi:hypothetical protein ACVNPX_07920 [Staphylococcus aureus]